MVKDNYPPISIDIPRTDWFNSEMQSFAVLVFVTDQQMFRAPFGNECHLSFHCHLKQTDCSSFYFHSTA